MKAKILKKLTHDGKELEQGTIVDVSGWRNAKSLEGSRYITFVTEEEVKAVEPKVKKVTAE
jgi:recombinational DNA repair protein RecT